MNRTEANAEAQQAQGPLGRIVGLAQRLFEVPMAGILLPDRHGKWQLTTARGGPRDLHTAFAAYADILGEYPMVVLPDLDDDPRFVNAITAPEPAQHLRFLAAARFTTPGHLRGPGYFCLFDTRPRQLRLEDRRTLTALAEAAGEELADDLRAGNAHPENGRTADIIELSRHDQDLSGGGAAPEPEAGRAREQGRELIDLNPSLPIDLRGRGDDELQRVRLERLVAESSDFIGLASLDGRMHYVNAAGRQLSGLDNPEDVKRTRLIDFLMREDRSFCLGTVMPSLMRNGSWEGDSRFRNFRTGAATEVGWNLFLIKDPRTGSPTSIATVARDITERKRAEVALRESEERFRHLVEQAGEAFFVYDLAGRVIDVNQEACDSLGYTRAELLDLSVNHVEITFDPIKGRERWKQMVPGVATTATGIHRRKDGTSFPTEARVGIFRSGGQRLLLALVRDITDRKRAEEALQQAHEQLEARVVERTGELALANDELRSALRENSRLAAAIESSQLGVLISDPNLPDSPTIFVNAAFTQMTGYERSEIMDRNCRLLQGPDTDPAMIARIRQCLAERVPFRGTLLNYKKDGTPFWNELTINPVFDQGGRLINYVGVQADVTAQMRDQEALRRSELRFSRMTANVPGMVYQLLLHEDGTANFPYVSEGCQELFGLTPAQMRPDACALLDRIHAEDIGEFLRTLNLSRQSGAAWSWEGRYLAAGEEVRWLQGAARPEKRGGSDTLWDGLLLDITPRKRAEQEIQARARQAAAVAELGQQALGSAAPDVLARSAAEVIRRTLGTDLSMVAEQLADGSGLIMRAHMGTAVDLTGKIMAPGAGSFAGYTVLTGAPVIVEDLRQETRFKVADYFFEEKAASALSVIIRGREQTLGALGAAVRLPRKFTAEDISFMQAVANVLASAIDRSRDEQALRKSEARNSAILDTALDCIVTVDHEGRVVEFNPAAEKTFGCTRAGLLGQLFRTLVPALPDVPSADLGALLPNLDERVELPARRLDGSLMTVELAITRIPVEGLPLFTAYLRDITQRKAGEAALNQAKEEAEEANRAKSDFLSRMSHELRTPLNAILGFGQILQMQNLPATQNDRVGHIVSAGRHLLGLINEVLDIARIEAGRVELSLEPVSVVDTLTETLELIRPLAAERGITLHAPGGDHPLALEHVMADRQRFKQVLLNLLSNAVKYNQTGGGVHVELHETPTGRLRVSVRDTGMGVPEDMLKRLFVAFDRLGREHSEIQGTGLGLALSKRLIEAMQGVIGVESVVGEGTTFWMEMPRAESQLGRATRLGLIRGRPGALEPMAGQHTVLYIEDNLSNLTLIEHLLAERPEIKLITSMQGRLGLDLARQHRPDLILLDLHLPDLPGWDVLAELQAEGSTSAIPVVVVSADATPRQIERLMKAGARAYLTKPLEVEQFHRILRQVLQVTVV